ncbi:cbccd8ca-4a3d-4783-a979-c4a14e07b7c4 [Sclerotinia trifoliorum]|uniref:Cbccd8ca-4a3d-4783-a979-c4a14e07b7c4 n=1 Tax=Sclerotinia trifoliorum TaxID=28548 RepID=A0A8H2W160_9HELO|nr:cbccd8ca-4a3d-4783-a979-c4a14e07b7c4 [Sclerotinia trifoliorum]
MAAHFSSIIDVVSSRDEPVAPPLAAPQKSVTRTYHSVQQPNAIELDSIKWAPNINRPPASGTTTPGVESVSGWSTPGWQSSVTPSALEISRPQTPDNEPEHIIQSFSNPPKNRFRMTSTCLLNFGNGLSDAAAGPLIPKMIIAYGIQERLVSLIFITQAIGYISAAFCIDAIRARMGRAKSIMLAEAIMSIGYVMIVTNPPFPVVVVAFLFVGFGMAINLSLSNVFAANLDNGTRMLGFMHGAYGIGGIIAPLSATALVSAGILWSHYYFIPLGMTLVNLAFAGWAFWDYEDPNEVALLNRTPSGNKPKFSAKKELIEMLKAAKLRAVLIGAIFIFSYQGAEVSISGWVVYFLQQVRGANTNAGYVTAGFWGGITLGRFFLSPIGHKIGERKFVVIVVVLSAIFEGLVWSVPNIIGDAVAVSIVGLLLGPVYPCAAYIFTRIIPRQYQVSGMSVISALGSSGGAIAPFTTGVLAQAVGNFVLHPIALGLFVVMMICWFLLPTVQKKEE